MALQSELVARFGAWRPRAPAVAARGRGHVTLAWSQPRFLFLRGQLLYRLEGAHRHRLPKWSVLYSGGKTSKRIDNLAPCQPHRFRLTVILKATAVPLLAEMALEHYGDEAAVYQHLDESSTTPEDDCDEKQPDKDGSDVNDIKQAGGGSVGDVIKTKLAEGGSVSNVEKQAKGGSDSNGNNEHAAEDGSDNNDIKKKNEDGSGERDVVKITVEDHSEAGEQPSDVETKPERNDYASSNVDGKHIRVDGEPRWLESLPSSETWTCTEPEGPSADCFCMTIQFGDLKQVQAMLEERPELLHIASPRSGLTPLATAVRNGDVSTCKFLLGRGAEVEQRSGAARTALHLAALAGHLPLVQLLLDHGADLQARDCNGLRAEHCAADAGRADVLRAVLARGGDARVTDRHGWTPLFRALLQGGSSELVAELVAQGGARPARDRAGLTLAAAAALHRDPHGRRRESVLRLVEGAPPPPPPPPPPRPRFTRLTRKVHHVRTLLNLV